LGTRMVAIDLGVHHHLNLWLAYRARGRGAKRQQFEASRRCALRSDIRSADRHRPGRRIFVHQKNLRSIIRATKGYICRSGEVTVRPEEMSSTPGLSQSPSGLMIT
jgi:hypothetical protein